MEISGDTSRHFIKQILGGAFHLIYGAFFVSISSFIMKYILIRTWSTSDYGAFVLVSTIIGLLGFFNEFSLNCTTTIFLSKKTVEPSNKKTLFEIFFTFGFLTIAVVVLTLGLGQLNIRTPFFITLNTYFWVI